MRTPEKWWLFKSLSISNLIYQVCLYIYTICACTFFCFLIMFLTQNQSVIIRVLMLINRWGWEDKELQREGVCTSGRARGATCVASIWRCTGSSYGTSVWWFLSQGIWRNLCARFLPLATLEPWSVCHSCIWRGFVSFSISSFLSCFHYFPFHFVNQGFFPRLTIWMNYHRFYLMSWVHWACGIGVR